MFTISSAFAGSFYKVYKSPFKKFSDISSEVFVVIAPFVRGLKGIGKGAWEEGVQTKKYMLSYF